MKNFIISLVLTFSISTFGQTKPSTTTTTTTTTTTKTTKTETGPTTQSKTTTTETKSTQSNPSKSTKKSKSKKSKSSKPKSSSTKPKSGNEVINKALYTPEEKEKTRQNFVKDVDQIEMTPEVKAEYTAIVQKHWERIEAANKGRTLTKDQATDYVNNVIGDQNEEIKRILTVDQYKKHEQIMNRYHNSVLYRIEQH